MTKWKFSVPLHSAFSTLILLLHHYPFLLQLTAQRKWLHAWNGDIFQTKKIQFTLQDGGSKFQMTDQNQHLIKTFFFRKSISNAWLIGWNFSFFWKEIKDLKRDGILTAKKGRSFRYLYSPKFLGHQRAIIKTVWEGQWKL